MNITAAQVKELREKTGAGMMDCKNALVQANGDSEAAEKYLREKGLSKAANKADRETKEGRVFTAIDGGSGAIVELNCETDFVANNEQFSELGNKLTKLALDSDTESIDAETPITDAISKIGENITLGRVYKIQGEGSINDYIHQNGKIGVLISFTGNVDESISKDVAMQVAALAPQYTSPDEVESTEIEKEKDIIRKQAQNEGRPEQVIEKMVEGKINKYFKEVCLVEQPFVKDDKKAIKDILPNGVTVKSFKRVALG